MMETFFVFGQNILRNLRHFLIGLKFYKFAEKQSRKLRNLPEEERKRL